MKCNSVYWMCFACWIDWRKRNSRCEWKCGDQMLVELKGCRIVGLVGILKTNTAISGLLESISSYSCVAGEWWLHAFIVKRVIWKFHVHFQLTKHTYKNRFFFLLCSLKRYEKSFCDWKKIPWKSEGITSLVQNDASEFLI